MIIRLIFAEKSTIRLRSWRNDDPTHQPSTSAILFNLTTTMSTMNEVRLLNKLEGAQRRVKQILSQAKNPILASKVRSTP